MESPRKQVTQSATNATKETKKKEKKKKERKKEGEEEEEEKNPQDNRTSISKELHKRFANTVMIVRKASRKCQFKDLNKA